MNTFTYGYPVKVYFGERAAEANLAGELAKVGIEDLIEAKRQIDSTLHKLREVVKTFEGKEYPARYKSQTTLAKRRIQAFEIANHFIENEIESN